MTLCLVGISSLCAQTILKAKDFGMYPNRNDINAAPLMGQLCDSVRTLSQRGEHVTIRLERGTYYFYPEDAPMRRYYISNHDQTNPKRVGIALEGLEGVTLDGRGAELLFHGQMLPVALVGSKDCTLKNFSIDFATPHITQLEIMEKSPEGTKMRVQEGYDWTLEDGVLWTHGEGWKYHADYAIAFDEETRRLVPQTSDMHIPTRQLALTADSLLWAKGWNDARLQEGDRLALRTWNRPAPGVFLADNVRTTLRNVKVHYAEGMGLLAQMCEDIEADGFSVCLRGKKDKRYFTTQADATHFSGCKGTIVERNGLFEGMMDDAINVHGTYLKLVERTDARTIVGQYMHGQSYGFRWGEVGDTVQFVVSRTMELLGQKHVIHSITPVDAPINEGVKQFRITFREELASEIDPAKADVGVENLTWTPRVVFERNVVRNNRARGSLFSTPRKVVVRRNLFDHTSGCAILLCGDCNGWYETGACLDVLIEKNTFINALTNEFQFTNAIISIYPEIPDLAGQKKYFHQNIRIQNNRFETFDRPLLYAKSVDGLSFKDNSVHFNSDFTPFHWNRHCFLLERVKDFRISGTKTRGIVEDVEQDIMRK